MKKVVCVFFMSLLIICNSVSASAMQPTDTPFRITKETTIGDVMKETDPITYYSFTQDERRVLNSVKVMGLDNNKEFSSATDKSLYNKNNGVSTYGFFVQPFAAAISSSQSSPSKGKLTYSATLEATEACPSLYLSAIVYNSKGYVISEMANRRYNKSKVTVANVKTGLTSRSKCYVTYYGVIKTPKGCILPGGTVNSTNNYVTIK